MPFGLEGMLQNVSKIKLKGGVVGKVSIVLIVISFSMASIAFAVREPWISVLALTFIFILSFPMLWRLISFADRNPQAALLEGAEFLKHEEISMGMKAEPLLHSGGNSSFPTDAIALSADDPEVLMEDPPETGADLPGGEA